MHLEASRRIAALILLFFLAGCGKKEQSAAKASKEDVHKLAAQVEALRKENEKLREATAPREEASKPPTAATGEPSESEMRQAIQERIDMVNGNIARMRNTRPDKNDPIASLMALSGAAMGDTRYEIGAFRKIGAEKAQGKPGYMCDYMLQLRATGKSAGPLDGIMKWGGSLNTARFVKNDGRWLWIAPGDEQ